MTFDARARAGWWLAAGLSGALLVSGCPRQAAPPTTSLRLAPATGAPVMARVTIDDLPLGSLRYITEHGVALPPGKHRITIEADGFLPWDAEVDAGPDGGLVRLPVELVRVPE